MVKRIICGDLISASDLGRYAYCPLSWYLRRLGAEGKGRDLQRGTEIHNNILKDVDTIKNIEKSIKEGERIIAVFSSVSILLVINALVLIVPEYFVIGDRDFSSVLLSFLAMIWIVFAVIFFLHAYSLKKWVTRNIAKGKESHKKSKYLNRKSKKISVKRLAVAIIVTSIILIFNGFTFIYKFDPDIWGRILVISSLLWLIGTSVILYITISKESAEKMGHRENEALIAVFSIVATVLAINGITMKWRYEVGGLTNLGIAMVSTAAIWLFIGLFIMVFSIFRGIKIFEDFTNKLISEKKLKESEVEKATYEEQKAATYFAFVAIALSLNALFIKISPNKIIAQIVLSIGVIWLIAASAVMVLTIRSASIANKMRTVYRLNGDMIYYDMSIDKKPPLLISRRFCISGRPDLIVQNENGTIIPIEIKTGKIPKLPRFSHIVQLGAYCLLVEEYYGEKPPYGVLRYQTQAIKGPHNIEDGFIMSEFKIAYDNKMKELIIDMANEMRDILRGKKEVHRNHNTLKKCMHCSRYDVCPERMDY